MKFKCSMTEAEAEAKAAKLREGIRVFFLLPRMVTPNDCRWLEFGLKYWPDAYAYEKEDGTWGTSNFGWRGYRNIKYKALR